MVKVERIGNMDKFSKRTDNKVLLHVFHERHYSKTFEDGNESIHFCADRHGAVSTLLLPLVLGTNWLLDHFTGWPKGGFEPHRRGITDPWCHDHRLKKVKIRAAYTALCWPVRVFHRRSPSIRVESSRSTVLSHGTSYVNTIQG